MSARRLASAIARCAAAPLALASLVACARSRATAPDEYAERFCWSVEETLALDWELGDGSIVRLEQARGDSERRSSGSSRFVLELTWRVTAPDGSGNSTQRASTSVVRLAFEPTAATWYQDDDEQGLLVAGRTRAGTPFVDRIALGRPRVVNAFDWRGRRYVADVVPGEPRGVSRCFEAHDGELSVIRGLLPRLPGAPTGAFHVITLDGESTWCVHTVAESQSTLVGSTPWDLQSSYSALASVEVGGHRALRLWPRIELFNDLPRAIDFVDTDGDGLVDRVQPFDS